MEFQLYGSIRGGLVQKNTDDSYKADITQETTADSRDGDIVPAVFGAGVDTILGSDDDVVTTPAVEVDADDNTPAGTHINNPDVAAAGREVDEESRDALELGNLSDPAFSRFGVKGSEDLGNGLSAGFQFERGMGADLNLRHENVWIGGGWGKFTIGNQSNPYRNAANWDQSWYIGGNNRYDDGGTRNNGIRYDSAGLGPVRFSLMAAASGADGAQKAYTTVVNDENERCLKSLGCAKVDAVVAADAVAPTDANPLGVPAKAAVAAAVAVDEADGSVSVVSHDAVEDEDSIEALIFTIHYDIGDIATINLGYQTNEQESNVLGTEDGGSYDNAVISANGSVGPLTWYVAYEDNSDNYTSPAVAHGEDVAVAGPGADNTPGTADDVAADAAGRTYVAQRYVAQDAETIGVFLALSVSESDLLYMEYEDSSVDGVDQYLEGLDKESILLGYSHKFGPHTAFVAEYLTVDTESDFTADSETLLATLKVDF